MSQPTPETSLPGHLLDLIDDVVWTTTLNGRELRYANPALERVCGRPITDFLDNPDLWLEMVHPDDRAIAEQSARTLLERGHSEATYRIVRPDGEVRWLRDRQHLIHDDTGQPQHIGGIATDITAQKQAEAASARNQQLLAAFFTQALDGVFLMMLDEPVVWNDKVDKEAVLDYAFAHQRVTRVNSTLLTQYRVTPEEFLGKTPNDLFKPAIEASRAVWRQLFDQGQLRVETYAPRFDGTAMMLEGDYLCLYDAAGRITGHVGVQRDITARQQAGAALRASEERFRAIVNSTSDMIYTLDTEQKVTGAFGHWVTSLGLTSDDLIGKTARDIFGPAAAAVHEQHIARVLAGESVVFAWRDQINDQIRYYETALSPLHRDENVIYGLVGIGRDVTPQKRAELALQESEARYRNLVEQGPDIIYQYALTGGGVYHSPQVETILGYSPAQLEQNPFLWQQSIHPDDLPRVKQAIKNFEAGQSFALEYRIIDAWGQEHWFLDRSVYRHDAEGGVIIEGVATDITPRKQIEEALRESENRLSLAQTAGKIGIWDLDLINDHLIWDARMYEMYGVEPETFDAAYEAWQQGVHPDDLARADAEVQQAIRDRREFHTEFRITRPAGEVRHIEAHGLVIYSAEGQPRRMVGVNTDVTERKQVEAALRDSEERFRLLFDHAPDAIILANVATGRLVNVNRAATRLLSKGKEEIIGLHFTDLHPPEMRATARRNFNRRVSAAATHRAWQPFENRVQRSDGQIVPVEITGGIFELQGQRLLIANFRDITERKQAENALKRSKERLELVLHGANLGMWDWNIQTGQVIYDERWAEMIGYALADIEPVAASWKQRVHPDDWPAVQATLAAHFEERSPFYRSEHRVRHKDGHWLWVYSAGMIYERAIDGSPLRAAGIHMNITERKRIEAELATERASLAQRVEERTGELRQALQTKDDFLATVTHELRTPLNGILGMIEILQQEVYGPLTEDQRQPVQIIRHSGRQLLTLINAILDFAAVDTLALERQPVLVADACQISLRKVEELAAQKQVHLSLQLADNDLRVQADPRRLQQILVNLLDNAIKFTPSGGAVTLSVSADPAEATVRLAVRDTGIGIAAEGIARLFKPFTQLDAGLSRQYDGAGMGLALVERLVRLHGGAIEVISAGVPGQGSCFTVSLPLVSVPETGQPGP